MDCTNKSLKFNTSAGRNSCVAEDINVVLAHPEFVLNVKSLASAVILSVVVLITLLGNALVIVSFYVEKHLRHPFNLFILNLSVTDFLVAMTGMSFYSINTVLGYWPLGAVMCGLWIYCDWGTTLASVFTLVAISIDRLWSVTWAVHYKNHNNKNKTAVIVTVIWLCALLIWTPSFIGDRLKHNTAGLCIWEPFDNKEFVILVAVCGHYVPCVIMVVCYCKVFLVMRQRASQVGSTILMPVGSVSTQNIGQRFVPSSASSDIPEENVQIQMHSRSDTSTLTHTCNHVLEKSASMTTKNNISMQVSKCSRDKRVFVTLTYIVSGYLICWFPFYIAFDIYAFKPELVSSTLYTIIYWTSYVNSTLNPFIYALTNRDFRTAFVKVLKTLCKYKS